MPVPIPVPIKPHKKPRRALTYTDQKISTREELKDYIMRKLGYPLHTVELSDEQLEDAIDDATMTWTKWATLPEKFIIKNLDDYEEGDAEMGIEEGFDMSDYNVAAVTAVNGNDTFGMYGADGLWGLSNCMLATGTYPFLGRSFGGSNYEGFVTYQAAFEFTKLAQRLTAQSFDYRFNPATQRLILIPNPKKDHRFGDMSVVFKAECVPEDHLLYGNDFVKRLAVAYAKITLGIIRSKFAGATFAGGITVDAGIGTKGEQELQELIEKIKSEEAAGTGLIMG